MASLSVFFYNTMFSDNPIKPKSKAVLSAAENNYHNANLLYYLHDLEKQKLSIEVNIMKENLSMREV